MDWKAWGIVVTLALLVGVVAWGVRLQRSAERPTTVCTVDPTAPHFEIQILGRPGPSNITWRSRAVDPGPSEVTYDAGGRYSRFLEEIPNFGLHTLETSGVLPAVRPLTLVPANGTSAWSDLGTFDPARLGARSTQFVIEETEGNWCGVARVQLAGLERAEGS